MNRYFLKTRIERIELQRRPLLTARIRVHHPGIKVVLGSGASDTAEKAARIGDDHEILPKPYDFPSSSAACGGALAS